MKKVLIAFYGTSIEESIEDLEIDKKSTEKVLISELKRQLKEDQLDDVSIHQKKLVLKTAMRRVKLINNLLGKLRK